MGREIKRVPMDFVFPIDGSFADAAYDVLHARHAKTCTEADHDECALPDWDTLLPKGEGWQLWQTVSDGPISPVFATPEELIDWMCQPDDGRGGRGWKRAVAEPFVKRQMSCPSVVMIRGKMVEPAEYVVGLEKEKV